MGSEDNGEDDAGTAAADDPSTSSTSSRSSASSTSSTTPSARRSRKAPKTPGPSDPSIDPAATPGAAKAAQASGSAKAPAPGKATGAEKGSSRSSSSTTSSAKSRAAQRKVNLEPGKSRSAGAATKTASPRTVTKRPFYKRGGFWFLVIVAEVLVALLISYRYERTSDAVDLAGAKLDTFCADVAAIRAAGEANGTIDVAQADATFRRQREAYLKLKQSAPDDLQPDLDRLVKSTDDLIETTEAIQARKRENPDYAGGTADLLAAQAALDPRLVLPNARLELAVRNGCKIELNGPTPTTAPVTTAPVTTAPVTTTAPGAGAGASGGSSSSVPTTTTDQAPSTPPPPR